MAISDKLMDIKALVEKHLDQDEIDELYELTEDIEILEQAKDVELQRLRALAEPSSVSVNELLPHVTHSAYQLCPKCNGQGIVSKPPWVAGDVYEWSSTQTQFTCDVCNGAKIIPQHCV